MNSSVLDNQLISFGGDEVFTIRNACEGVAVFGGTGSGKTSGSGAVLARSYLSADMGGLVLTVKPDECNQWLEWAEETGRLDDVVVIHPDNAYRFDFLLYEQAIAGENLRTTNIVDLFSTAMEIASSKGKNSGGGDNQFWEDAATELISKSIDLLILAQLPITVDNILNIINSAPTSKAEVTKPPNEKIAPFMRKKKMEGKPDSFLTFFATAINRVSLRNLAKELDFQKKRDARFVSEYFLKDYALLGERTRSSIKLHVATVLYQLLSGDIGKLLCGGAIKDDEILITPDATYLEGKIIIVDMPVMSWKRAGKMVQGLFKYLFQRCIERRDFKRYKRPVFLWSDEAQYFVNSHDQLFLTTARSSGCCTVFLTQNIENYYEAMGEHSARSMLGNLQTKIFHQNTDLATNNYGSDIIGSYWADKGGMSVSVDSTSINTSEQLIKYFQPEKFNFLRTGGTDNNLIVEAVVVRSGRKWAGNLPYSIIPFRQG